MSEINSSAPPGLITPINSQADYQLLFLGNSHSAFNNLPGLLTTLIETGLPGKSADSELAPGFKFLDERLNDGVTQELLESRDWTHVFLQAQKYSSSGLYFYPTVAAEQWIRRVKTQNGRPILFPEWPRRGNTEEGQRIHNLHLSISSRESACVAPIGLAWEESIARYPTLALHAADGNHSNLSGALLSAYVFYQVTTGRPAAALPYISAIDISADTQKNLRELASFVVDSNLSACPDLEAVANVAGVNSADERIPALNHWGLLIMILLMMIIGVRMRKSASHWG